MLLQARWPGGGSCGPPQTRPAELWSPERESCGGQGMWADLTSQDAWGKLLQRYCMTSEAVLHISHSITSNPSSLCRWYEGSQGAGLICSLHSPTSLPTVSYKQIGRQHHVEDVNQHLVLFPGLFLTMW